MGTPYFQKLDFSKKINLARKMVVFWRFSRRQYRVKITQEHRTNNVLRRVKVILYDSMLNTLSIFISYGIGGHDKTCLSISKVEPLYELMQDPPQHHISDLQDPTSVPPLSRNPLEEPLIRTSSFHQEEAHDMTLHLSSTYALLGKHPYDVFALGISLRPSWCWFPFLWESKLSHCTPSLI